ncbi:hypothetical protein NLU13_3618 [Sarocladium strictum]|uniref:Glutamine amidotransferase domain-containing protein n=1 Tax=Sarocladium strictum TaxID=5046 RepID=A0AA39GMD2_SARSR|nr:hypothetical protein NLU13_3618 [Sarocladium strictum]
MPRVFRVAVLECDKTIEPVRANRGQYVDIFRSLLTRALESEGHDIHLEVSQWDVVASQSYPRPEDFDGLLLSGSKHCAFHDEPWILSLVDYVREVLHASDKPVVGICFGHQIIARALGAKLGINPGGWEISVDRIDLNEHGQELFGIPTVQLHQMHRDAVLEVPEGTVNLGGSPSCRIQGLFKPGTVLSFQAHPEFDEFIMEKVVGRRHEQAIFDDAMFESGMARAGLPHDGLLVAQAIWRLFLGTAARKDGC